MPNWRSFLKVDHIVVHIDDNPEILQDLKKEAERCGFPFEPGRGKGNRGVRVSNLWVGDQYFEIPQVFTKGNGGRAQSWVERYNKGNRGIYCLYLRAKNLERLQSDLAVRGIMSSMEKTTYKTFFGLFTVTKPWQYLRLPPIPGSDFEIGFFDCDEVAAKKVRPQMKPNSMHNGIMGISDVDIMLPDYSGAVTFLKALFPNLEVGEKQAKVILENSELHFHQSPSQTLEVVLDAESINDGLVGKAFSFQNVTLRTKPVRAT